MPETSLEVLREVRQDLRQRLMEAHRRLREEEKTLGRLKYEWALARRLRDRAGNEEERELWRVQSDVYMGLVMQQEQAIAELKETIAVHRAMLAEVEADIATIEEQRP
ncbi:MAG: hypothetical protein D6759_11495 [Chloroflexi bacterium]|nr:MAG: hypothetical protein D6759_11495 [Chloroflexota bacterium]